MDSFYFAYRERAAALELWILGGISFPMDYAAVPKHRNEHVFICISDGLLSLFAFLNNYLDLYI